MENIPIQPEGGEDENATEDGGEVVDVKDSSSSGSAIESTRPRWDTLIETLVVISIGVVPYLFSCLQGWLWQSDDASSAFVSDYGWLAQTGFCVSTVTLFVMYWSDEKWSYYGIVPPKLVADLLVGLVVWFGFLLTTNVWFAFVGGLDGEVSGVGANVPSSFTTAQLVLLYVACGINGFTEELVMRCYLIPRFEKLLHSTWSSVLLTSALFASYHLYQGLVSASYIFWFGMVCGVAFCMTRRIWPIAIAHALQDVVASLQNPSM